MPVVRIEHTDDGLVVVRHGPVEALRREHELLVAAAGPGVVRTRGLADRDGRPVLVLDHVGGRTLAAARPTVFAAVDLARSLLRILDHLHRSGIAHGAVDARHVIVTPAGPTLVGFTCARRTDDGGDPAADLRGVARTLQGLVAGDRTLEPAPDARWRRARWSGYVHGAVLNLCDRVEIPGGAPVSAGAFAAALAALVDEQPSRTGGVVTPRRPGPVAARRLVEVCDLVRIRLRPRRVRARVGLRGRRRRPARPRRPGPDADRDHPVGRPHR